MFPEGTAEDVAVEDLKEGLEGMARELFGDTDMRWVDAYFPFTDPSLELEVYFEGDWLEVLGCGVIQRDIIRSSGRGEAVGWAFGLGLERLAMILFGVPDIRLFWSTDPRFLSQFKRGEIIKFKPYSKYPPCYKDVSFWLPEGTVVATIDESDDLEAEAAARLREAEATTVFHPNDLYEVVRSAAGDMAEQVELIDAFTHPKTHRLSHCYRITFRDMDRSLTNAEVDEIQLDVRNRIVQAFGVELR